MQKIRYEAHRGVSTEYPENTMAAFRAAWEQGYDMVEMDPIYSSDGDFLILHDATPARTCRAAGEAEALLPCKATELSTLQLRSLDAGSWKGETFRGEKIPLLSEALAFGREKKLPLKLDNKIFSFPAELQEKLWTELKKSGAPYEITCPSYETLCTVGRRLPEAPLHYDGPVTREILEQVAKTLPGRSITVWLPLKTPLTDWVRVAYADRELSQLVHSFPGLSLGVWILADEKDLAQAIGLGADIIETTGGVKPTVRRA